MRRHTLTGRARTLGRGFSLIELIAVLLVISIMAVAAVPAISRAADQRVAVASDLIVRDLNFARDSGTSTGLRTWVVFSVPNQTYTLSRESRLSPGRAGRVTLTDASTGQSFVQALNTGDLAGLSLASVNIAGSNEVAFDWQGKPFGQNESALSSNGTITLSSGRSIIINAASGAISLQ